MSRSTPNDVPPIGFVIKILHKARVVILRSALGYSLFINSRVTWALLCQYSLWIDFDNSGIGFALAGIARGVVVGISNIPLFINAVVVT